MRICIYGAGAIGGFIAGYLARLPEVDVSVVARGPHLAAMRERGLRVVTPDAAFDVTVRATDDPAELGEQDYVFLTLKQHQVADALPGIATLLGPATVVLPPTTGIPYWYFHRQPRPSDGRRLDRLDPGGRLWETIGPERVIGCVYWVGAEVPAPGVVRQDQGIAGLPIGEPDGSTSPRIARLAEVMAKAGLRAPIRGNIRAEIWMKMINSMCWNPVALLTAATLGQIAAAPDVVAIVRTMMIEAEAVAAAFGLGMPAPMEKRIAGTLASAAHKMSMLQDLERGRPIEIDVLIDSIVSMREIVGIDTPTIDTVLALARRRGTTLTEANNNDDRGGTRHAL